jgi:copper transport protein
MPFLPASYRVAQRIGAAAVALLALSSVGATPLAAPPPADEPADERLLHLRLEKSEPATGAVLGASPSVIRLWYSLPPELAVTVVRLTRADGNTIPLGALRRGRGASDPVETDVKQPLPNGSYTVSWKTSSRDGHPIRGEFKFAVKGAAN